MYTIYKITSNHTVDFAAEELKKYLRMMMPRCGEIAIEYSPDAKDGFRLGLMQDFGLDTSEAEDVTLDDFKVCDCMLTNFHLPQSTLLMMISALAGRERVLCSYALAVRGNYKFFSYGDCMLIV